MFKIVPTDKQTLPEYIDVCIVLIISGRLGFCTHAFMNSLAVQSRRSNVLKLTF